MYVRRLIAAAAVMAVAAAVLPLTQASLAPTPALAVQPVPNHPGLVPAVPRSDTPRISDGEIWDMAVVRNRVFIAGSFTNLANTTGNTATFNQPYLASYNFNTGRISRKFKPTFDGTVKAVEASPDGTKLFVAGTFKTVDGVTRTKVASLNLTTGAPVPGFDFTGTTNNAATALAATNTTLYVGGRFTTINGQSRTSLAAVDTTTGAVDLGFDNPITGGIGVGGMLQVQELKLTHDESKLLVVHTGRQVAGQDRLAIAWISTKTQTLLPWRTRLWDQYLPVVGGVQRVYAADISPDDSYFVVTSGSGGDRPPISDTAVAFPVKGGDSVEPLWVARCFDSVYSVAITEKAVYIGGHFSWNESPTANQPWPGLDNVGYGTGQGLSGYGLGDQVVRRDHLGALDPATGTALEWNPGSTSFEGSKAMLATSRGLFVGGDGSIQGGVRTGRVAFYDLNTAEAPTRTDTTIKKPIEGRVVPAGTPFTVRGTAKAPAGVKRVAVEVQDNRTKRYLQDNLTTWGAFNTIPASLRRAGKPKTRWSLHLTVDGSRSLNLRARTVTNRNKVDHSKALKTMETFVFDDQTPSTRITGPGSPQPSTSFTMTGTANDDHGVTSLSYWFRDENGEYLQDDGSVAPIYNTFRGQPDIVGATSATWSYDVTLPHEGQWRGSATATDTSGQADLRSATRNWLVSSSAQAPVVTIQQPTVMTPPASTPTVTITPGSPVTFSGTASDSTGLRDVLITLRNNGTTDALGADGAWGPDVISGQYRISPANIAGQTYNWSYTTPFTLPAGSYDFTVRATNDLGLATPRSGRGSLTINAQVPGDAFPNGLITDPGVGQPSLPSNQLDLVGTATDDKGVSGVRVSVYDRDSGRYLKSGGNLGVGFSTLNAVLADPGATSTNWSMSRTLPGAGDYLVTAWAVDTAGQLDPSTNGATGRYLYFPGDSPPGFVANLGQPVDGSSFGQGRIIVSGRAEDDQSIAKVEVAVEDSTGHYLGSNGSFTSTDPSWRAAFLTSPGSAGSNFSYTTPVVPDGTYSVMVRGTDQHGQIGDVRTATGVTVTHPANNPPVAHATVSCNQNVCSFDARSSTDENPSSLSYAWSFGPGQGSASGAVPVKTFTGPGTFPVALTVTDEWNESSTTTVPVTISEPAGNSAPVPVITTSCIELTCGVTSAGTTDPQPGDVITYVWSWGDGSPDSTGPAASHVYSTTGTYTVTLTATDGWARSASTTRSVTRTEPGGNAAPTVAFTATCSGLDCQLDSTGTFDPDGNQIRYSWSWGDGTPASTTAYPTHSFATGGTYTIELTVTDGWNRSSTVSHPVTVVP